MSGPGVLTVRFGVLPEGEDLVNRWYDEVHIRERLAIPGFTGVRRYRSLQEPLEYLAMWDVEDAAWPFDPEYRAIPSELWRDRIGHLRTPSTRTGWEEIPTSAPPAPNPPDAPAPGIRLVVMDIPAGYEDDFDAWYEQDHIPDLMRRPEYLGIRRFRRLDFDPSGTVLPAAATRTCMAVWYLTDGGLHLRADFVPAEPTAWGRRIAAYRTAVQHSSWRELPVALTTGPAESAR